MMQFGIYAALIGVALIGVGVGMLIQRNMQESDEAEVSDR